MYKAFAKHKIAVYFMALIMAEEANNKQEMQKVPYRKAHTHISIYLYTYIL